MMVADVFLTKGYIPKCQSKASYGCHESRKSTGLSTHAIPAAKASVLQAQTKAEGILKFYLGYIFIHILISRIGSRRSHAGAQPQS